MAEPAVTRDTVWTTVPMSCHPCMPISPLQSSQAPQVSLNRFAILSDDNGPPAHDIISCTTTPTSNSTDWTFHMSDPVLTTQDKHNRKANQYKHRLQTLWLLVQNENLFLTESIAKANAELAALATSVPPISTAFSIHQEIAVLPTHATAYLVHQLCPPTASASPILNHNTGKTLEHRQLQQLPK